MLDPFLDVFAMSRTASTGVRIGAGDVRARAKQPKKVRWARRVGAATSICESAP